jgi:L-rhamnonate dehydratase
MKITDIRAVRLNQPATPPKTQARRASWAQEAEVANPMSRFPKVKRSRGLWLPKKWEEVYCKVTLEDGTWGLGSTSHGRAVAAVIDDHLAPNLIGEDIFTIEKMSDMMFRMTKPYGSTGLASYAVSAVDLALWGCPGQVGGKASLGVIGRAAQREDVLLCHRQ